MSSASPARVLVVDDEAAMREVLAARLEGWGHDVTTADSCEAASRALSRSSADVVISDLVLPDGTGLDVLERHRRPGCLFVIVTAYGTVDTAVAAMKGGAAEFLTKPLDYVALRLLLRRHLEQRVVTVEAELDTADLLLGRSPAMAAVREQIAAVAPSQTSVMVVGESGTGKELVARSIVAQSHRADGPYVPVNAAAISDGLFEGELLGHERGAFTGATESRAGMFERAHRGTLFLDEITEMPARLQPKLLRVLEDGHVRRVGGNREVACDVRLIAATNRQPDDAIAAGVLRRDIFHRLCVFRIDVPPLRERLEDVALLSQYLLADFARREGRSPPAITTGALDRLRDHHYPGNVRELRNVLARASLVSGGKTVDEQHIVLDASVPRERRATEGITLPSQVTAAEAERILIAETMRRTNHNKSEVARRLGLDVKTVRKKLKDINLGTDP
ncbi:MAG: sigma-54 dependent transcriptional regulator [Myxococcota bacterium]